jgi:hypothetical protein
MELKTSGGGVVMVPVWSVLMSLKIVGNSPGNHFHLEKGSRQRSVIKSVRRGLQTTANAVQKKKSGSKLRLETGLRNPVSLLVLNFLMDFLASSSSLGKFVFLPNRGIKVTFLAGQNGEASSC